MAVYNYIEANGAIIVDTEQIKSEVEQEWLDNSGATTLPDPSSVEGRLIDAEVTSRQSVARNNAKLANQINPNLSLDVFFDALYALLGGERDAAERSTVDCVLTGVDGTVIPANSYVQDDNDELWFLVSEAIIGIDNQVTASFRSENFGPIAAEIGEINQIVSSVLGWETVTNPAAATVGKEEQSLISGKIQRQIEIAANSRSTDGSVVSAVSQLEGVSSLSFRSNESNDPEIIDGVSMPAKSSWLCVDGGASSEIAEAYATSRWGTKFYGFSNTVTEPYTDPRSGQTFQALIDRPDVVDIKVRVSARVASSANAIDDVKNAVLAYQDGLIDGFRGFVLGNDVSPFEMSAAINQVLSPSKIYVADLRVTTVSDDDLQPATIPIDIWKKARVTVNDIDVVIL